MDDKVGRRFKLRNRWRKRKDVKTYRQLVTKFLSTHKQSFFASILLLVVIVLLFGIFSFFSAPTTNTVTEWGDSCRLQHLCGAGKGWKCDRR